MTPKLPLTDDLLSAFLDGELPADKARAVEQAVADDPAAQGTLDAWRKQDAALGTLYAPAVNDPLPAKLTATLAAERTQNTRIPPAFIRIAAMLALVAIGAAGGWTLARLSPGGALTNTSQLAENAIASYKTFVVEVVHPVEVEADQSEHLVQWISNRLGTSISPPDFAKQGFRLMGGRVVPSTDGPAAQFMYKNDLGQRVTLYVATPSDPSKTAFQFASSGDVQSFYWIDGDLSYAVVGNLPRETLRAIATEAYDQLI